MSAMVAGLDSASTVTTRPFNLAIAAFPSGEVEMRSPEGNWIRADGLALAKGILKSADTNIGSNHPIYKWLGQAAGSAVVSTSVSTSDGGSTATAAVSNASLSLASDNGLTFSNLSLKQVLTHLVRQTQTQLRNDGTATGTNWSAFFSAIKATEFFEL